MPKAHLDPKLVAAQKAATAKRARSAPKDKAKDPGGKAKRRTAPSKSPGPHKAPQECDSPCKEMGCAGAVGSTKADLVFWERKPAPRRAGIN